MSEKEFVDGLIVKPPHESAPSFVKCSISIKRKDLGNWLRRKPDDWINLDVKVAKSGKWYAEVNDWKPKQGESSKGGSYEDGKAEDQTFLNDDIPF